MINLILDSDEWIDKYLLFCKLLMAKLGEDIVQMYAPYENYGANWKLTTFSKQKFEIYDRYEIIDVSTHLLFNLFSLVGQGAYGIVVAAKDKEPTQQGRDLVAIKKIDKAFEHKIFAKRTLRELRLLKLLNH